MNSRGMVVKVKPRTCIVLTADGEYHEVPLPGGTIPRLGQEIKLSGRKKLPYLKQFMAVASLLIILMAGFLYFGETPPAAAYLTIDINPSIELGVSTKGKVISASAMDDEGIKLLNEVKVKGRDLHEAVEVIVAQAVADNYFEQASDNVILATLTVTSSTEPPVDLNSVYEAIMAPVAKSGLESDVIIEPVEPEMREKAAASGISTGRYLLLNKSEQKGSQISISDVTSMSLGKLKKEKKMDLVDLVAGKDKKGDDNKPDQKEKAKQRGIYVKNNKSAVQHGKPEGKEKTFEKKQGHEPEVKDKKNKEPQGNGDVKTWNIWNRGQDKGKSGAYTDKRENNGENRDRYGVGGDRNILDKKYH